MQSSMQSRSGGWPVDAGQRRLTIHVDSVPGSPFADAKAKDEHKLTTTRSSACCT
jgi:hypothetical protein